MAAYRNGYVASLFHRRKNEYQGLKLNRVTFPEFNGSSLQPMFNNSKRKLDEILIIIQGTARTLKLIT